MIDLGKFYDDNQKKIKKISLILISLILSVIFVISLTFTIINWDKGVPLRFDEAINNISIERVYENNPSIHIEGKVFDESKDYSSFEINISENNYYKKLDDEVYFITYNDNEYEASDNLLIEDNNYSSYIESKRKEVLYNLYYTNRFRDIGRQEDELLEDSFSLIDPHTGDKITFNFDGLLIKASIENSYELTVINS